MFTNNTRGERLIGSLPSRRSKSAGFPVPFSLLHHQFTRDRQLGVSGHSQAGMEVTAPTQPLLLGMALEYFSVVFAGVGVAVV